jgi:hypothetical protein
MFSRKDGDPDIKFITCVTSGGTHCHNNMRAHACQGSSYSARKALYYIGFNVASSDLLTFLPAVERIGHALYM